MSKNVMYFSENVRSENNVTAVFSRFSWLWCIFLKLNNVSWFKEGYFDNLSIFPGHFNKLYEQIYPLITSFIYVIINWTIRTLKKAYSCTDHNASRYLSSFYVIWVTWLSYFEIYMVCFSAKRQLNTADLHIYKQISTNTPLLLQEYNYR